MRTLIILTLVLSAGAAWAQSANSVQYLFTAQSLNGTAGSQNINPSNNTSSTTDQIIGDAKISKNVSIEIGLNATKRDYSSVVLLEKNGQNQNLGSKFNQVESTGSIKGALVKGPNLIEATEKASLDASPYSQHSHSLAYTFRGPYDVFKTGASLNETLTDQPSSYFVARDFSTQKRPDLLNALTQTIWLEYVVTEEAKVRATALHGSRSEDRPDHFGEEIQLGYALSPQYSLRIALQNIEEQYTPLLDERGRFKSRSVDGEITWLMNYRTTLSVGYGLILEEENNKADGSSDKIGHDVYSVAGSYRLAPVTLSANVLYQVSSQSTEEFRAQGGVLWEL